MTHTSQAMRYCLRCDGIKPESAFDRSPGRGTLYRVCRLCKMLAKDRRYRRENAPTDEEVRQALWEKNYPEWQTYGYHEARSPASLHSCRSDLLIARLIPDEIDADNEVVLYCNGCLAMWRTGITSQCNESLAALMRIADARGK